MHVISKNPLLSPYQEKPGYLDISHIYRKHVFDHRHPRSQIAVRSYSQCVVITIAPPERTPKRSSLGRTSQDRSTPERHGEIPIRRECRTSGKIPFARPCCAKSIFPGNSNPGPLPRDKPEKPHGRTVITPLLGRKVLLAGSGAHFGVGGWRNSPFSAGPEFLFAAA